MLKNLFSEISVWFLVSVSLGACGLIGSINPKGTAEGFGGGDPFNDMLESTRDLVLLPVAKEMEANGVQVDPCDFAAVCEFAEHPLCNAVPALNLAQRQYCTATILSNVSALRQRLESREIRLVGVNHSLYNHNEEVTAKTGLSEKGDIQVSIPRVQGSQLSSKEISVLLMHEFMHKVRLAATAAFLDDTDAIGPFTGNHGGNTLLNALGTAMVLYQDIIMKGTGIGHQTEQYADVSVSGGTALQFGDLQVGYSKILTVQLVNRGDLAASNFAVSLNTSAFSADNSGCMTRTQLAAMDECNIQIQFKPLAEGSFLEAVTVSYNSGSDNRTLSLSLSGRGKKPRIVAWVQKGGGKMNVVDSTSGTRVSSGLQNLIPFASTSDLLMPYAYTVLSRDMNGDSVQDLVISNAPGGVTTIRIIDGLTGEPIHTWNPFGSSHRSGAALALFDKNGDGTPDVIAMPLLVDSRIKIFDGKTGQVLLENNPLGEQHLQGANLGVADVMGSGQAELIAVGRRRTGDSLGRDVSVIRIRLSDLEIVGEMIPNIPSAFTNLGLGDLDGNGIAEIVLANDDSKEIEVFNFGVADSIASVRPYGLLYNAGIDIAVADMTGNGKADIVAAPANGSDKDVITYRGEDLVQLRAFRLPDQAGSKGIRLTTGF